MKVISSIHHNLLEEFLFPNLTQSIRYDRISGYFCSSILQCAGEEFDHFTEEGAIRVVCNSKVQWDDIQIAKYARFKDGNKQAEQSQMGRKAFTLSQLAIEWSASNPRRFVSEFCAERSQNMMKFQRLYDLLSSKRLQIRVIPSHIFLPSGKEITLLHGKAGIFTLPDNSHVAFYTSANDSANAWISNYEILCIAETPGEILPAIDDFELFWNHPAAIDLSECDFIMQDIHALSRDGKHSLADWRQTPDPVSPFVCLPISMKENGLMRHQQLFIQQVFEEHQTAGGSRLILADDVGLGKTISLTGAALLTFLLDQGKKPVLILCPPDLMRQWQSEMWEKFSIRSCYWDNKRWITESEQFVPHPVNNQLVYPKFSGIVGDFNTPPRPFIIVSTGLFVNDKNCRDKVNTLLRLEYSCIILDEGHKARREDPTAGAISRAPKYGHLYQNLRPFAERTHSFLIGTATPVQLHPIEAWDLLNLISWSKNELLGSATSLWRSYKTIQTGLDYCVSEPNLPNHELWDWVRDPLPPNHEDPRVFQPLRMALGLSSTASKSDTSFSMLNPVASSMIRSSLCRHDYAFFTMHNPFIRHIVRRSRKALEENHNEYGVPILPHIEVQTVDGTPEDFYLSQVYQCLSQLLHEIRNREHRTSRKGISSLVAEHLLRRVSSSIYAGSRSLTHFAQKHGNIDLSGMEDSSYTHQVFKPNEFTETEWQLILKAYSMMQATLLSYEFDPKIYRIAELFNKGAELESGSCTAPWKELGCILFSQYYDTAAFFAQQIHTRLPGATWIGLYAGGGRSAIYKHGVQYECSKDELIHYINTGRLKILFATDAACEGLNLQALSTLINIDLPWNPTKLSQRVGRIRRTNQKARTIYVCNMRYKGTVEDKVYGRLCSRFAQIYDFFGTMPDYFDVHGVWDQALSNSRENELEHTLCSFQETRTNPLQLRYDSVFRHELERGKKYQWNNRDYYVSLGALDWIMKSTKYKDN